jgi:hypothetical protein
VLRRRVVTGLLAAALASCSSSSPSTKATTTTTTVPAGPVTSGPPGLDVTLTGSITAHITVTVPDPSGPPPGAAGAAHGFLACGLQPTTARVAPGGYAVLFDAEVAGPSAPPATFSITVPEYRRPGPFPLRPPPPPDPTLPYLISKIELNDGKGPVTAQDGEIVIHDARSGSFNGNFVRLPLRIRATGTWTC